MSDWLSFFKFNPIVPFQNVQNPMIKYMVKRDLLEEPVESVETLWEHPQVKKILKKQTYNGAWPDKNAKKHINSPTNYQMVETYRNLATLIEIYGFNKNHPAIKKAVEFIFTTQTDEGDFRGVYGSQHSPNYCAGLLELIVKAGYENNKQVEKAFKWLIKSLQNDGGWVLPHLAAGLKMQDCEKAFAEPKIYTARKSLPFSHMITGIVIRAFANNPKYRSSPEATKAGELLIQRFFKPDVYSSRQKADYWTKYSFPFWWTDLICVLDSLSKMEFSINNPGINNALKYYKKQQMEDGTWDFYAFKGKTHANQDSWLSFTLIKTIKRFLGKKKV